MKKAIIVFIIVFAIVVAGFGYRLYRASMQKSSQPCWNTLACIEGAKEQWALESRATPGTPVTFENIRPYLSYPGGMPKCNVPGGTYIIGKIGEEPRRTVHGTVSDFKGNRY